MSDASVVAKEANRVILAMRLRAEKAEADAEALRKDVGVALLAIKTERDKAEALASAGSKMVLACQVSAPGEAQFDGSYQQLREALARYRGEK